MEEVLDTFETVFVINTKWEFQHEFWVPFNILTSSFCTFSAILITMEQFFGDAISCYSVFEFPSPPEFSNYHLNVFVLCMHVMLPDVGARLPLNCSSNGANNMRKSANTNM